MGEWALYGGFVGQDENLDDAASRVLYELTGMRGVYMRQVGAYGEPLRDPCTRVISVAYCALINVADYDENLRRQYDLQWMELGSLPPLFSDHGLMLNDALNLLRKELYTEPLCFSLLPEKFTLTLLQQLFEAIMGKELDKRNFRKRIKQCDSIVSTGLIDKLSSRRGAMLYTFDTKCKDFHI